MSVNSRLQQNDQHVQQPIVSEPAAPSLPPVSGETARSLSPLHKSFHKLEKDSLIRKKAVAIVAMRAQGFSTDEIAAELHLKPSSISTYVHRAAKSGFLVNSKGSLLSDPKDQVEFELAHKVVRNLNAALDGTLVTTAEGEIKPVSKSMRETTLEVAKGTLFKRFDQPKEGPLPSMQVLAVRIEMPTASQSLPHVVEGSIGGVPATFDDEGEIADDNAG